MANPPRNRKQRGQSGAKPIGTQVPEAGTLEAASAPSATPDPESSSASSAGVLTCRCRRPIVVDPTWERERCSGCQKPVKQCNCPPLEDAPHVHTRECYQDAALGPALRVCARWTPAELADLRATSPEQTEAPLELRGNCLTCAAKGVKLTVQRQCAECVALGVPAEVLACTGCARVAHAYCGGKEGDLHVGCAHAGTWKRWPLVDGKPAQPVPLRRALLVIEGGLTALEALARDAVLYARLYPPTAGNKTSEALRSVSRDVGRLWQVVDAVARQPAVGGLCPAAREQASAVTDTEGAQAAALPHAAAEWLTVQRRVDEERAELEKTTGEPAPLGALNYWGCVVEHRGKTYDGRTMVRWSELTSDQREAWEAGALAVLREAGQEDIDWAKRMDLEAKAEASAAPDAQHEVLRVHLDELAEGLAWLVGLLNRTVGLAEDDARAGALGLAEDLRQLLLEAGENRGVVNAMLAAWRPALDEPQERLRAMRTAAGRPAALRSRHHLPYAVAPENVPAAVAELLPPGDGPREALRLAADATSYAALVTRALLKPMGRAPSAKTRRAAPMLERIVARTKRDAQALADLVLLLGLPDGVEVPAELAEMHQALAVGPVDDAPGRSGTLRELVTDPAPVVRSDGLSSGPEAVLGGFQELAAAELRPRVEALGWTLVGREGPHWLAARRFGEGPNGTAELRAAEGEELLELIATINETAAQWLRLAQDAEGEAAGYIRKRAEALGWKLEDYDGGPWCAVNEETGLRVRHPDGLTLLELLKAAARAEGGLPNE